jgi:nitrite reductase [NAD(P)H] small subunit
MTATLLPLCTVDDITPGLGRGFEVCGRSVAVFRGRDGRVFAMEGRCPHRGGPLADGMLIGDQVVCPLHAYRYDGATGSCDQSEACAVKSYAAEVRDNTIFVAVPQS